LLIAAAHTGPIHRQRAGELTRFSRAKLCRARGAKTRRTWQNSAGGKKFLPFTVTRPILHSSKA